MMNTLIAIFVLRMKSYSTPLQIERDIENIKAVVPYVEHALNSSSAPRAKTP